MCQQCGIYVTRLNIHMKTHGTVDVVPPSPSHVPVLRIPVAMTSSAAILCDESDDQSEQDLFDDCDVSLSNINHMPVVSCEKSGDTMTPIGAISSETLVAEFQCHMASIEGGDKARPESYSLAAKQISLAIENNISQLTKNNLYKMYVNPLLTQPSKVSVKTVINKLKQLEYFCKFLLEHNCRK